MTETAYTVKRLIEWMLSPVGITCLFLTAGLAWKIFRGRSPVGARLLATGALCFLVIWFSPLAHWLLWSLERHAAPPSDPPAAAEIRIVAVLSGYAEEQPEIAFPIRLSDSTLARLTEGLRLYRRLPGAKILTSGGIAHRGERSLAAIMADFLHQMGVPVTDLLIEGASNDTYENLVEIRKVVRSEPFILVTSASHMRRTTAVARKLGMRPIAAPAHIRTLIKQRSPGTLRERLEGYVQRYVSMNNFQMLQEAYHEYAGHLWYRMTDRL